MNHTKLYLSSTLAQSFVFIKAALEPMHLYTIWHLNKRAISENSMATDNPCHFSNSSFLKEKS